MPSVSSLLPLAALLYTVSVSAQCNADNVLRALRGGGWPATSLCNSLINFPVPAVTVVPPPGVTPPPAYVYNLPVSFLMFSAPVAFY